MMSDDDDFEPSEKPTPPDRKKENCEPNKKKKRKSEGGKSKSGAKPAKKPPKKKQKSSKPQTMPMDAAREAIKRYLIKQNRPYSHTQVFENLHRTIKKSQVPVLLQQLADRGVLTHQAFGKTKLYYANQAAFKDLDPNELAQMDAKIATMKNEAALLAKQIKEVGSGVQKLESSMTNDKLDQEIQSLKGKNHLNEERLKNAKCNQTVYSKDTLTKMDSELKKYLKEWKKHKRAVTDMLGDILESCSMKQKKLEDKIGMERNEAADTNLQEISKQLV